MNYEELQKAYIKLAKMVLESNRILGGRCGGQTVGQEEWRVRLILSGVMYGEIKENYFKVKEVFEKEIDVE